MVKPAKTLLLLLALMALLKDVTRCEAYRGLQRPHVDYRHKAMMRLHSVESDERIMKEGGGGGDQIDENSAVALIAGTTIGAGVLALPNVSYEVGFVPASFALVASWLIMCISSLLIAEVSTNLAKQDSKFEGKSYLTMISEVLGEKGGLFATGIYIVLHYALLVAYDAGAGDAFSRTLGVNEGTAIAAFAAAMGVICGFGGEATITLVNNGFFAIVLASFVSLIAIGTPGVSPANLTEMFHPERLSNALPVMVLAFVHHNVVPTVSRQLNYDKKAIQKAVATGTMIPLVMFLLWNFVVLGIGPIQSIDSTEAFTDRSSFDTVGVLASVGGGENGGIRASELAEVFSASAIVTSVIGFFIGLSDLFKDYLSPSLSDEEENRGATLTDLGVAVAVAAPPAVVAVSNPSIFVNMLDLAGTYGITVLFLMLPSAMSIVLRSRTEQNQGTYDSFVPLGNLPATLCIASSAALILQKVLT